MADNNGLTPDQRDVLTLQTNLRELLVAEPFGEEQEAEVLRTLRNIPPRLIEQFLASDGDDAQTLVELAIWANSLPIVRALVKVGAHLNVVSIDSEEEIFGGDKSMVALARQVAGEDSELYEFVSTKCAVCDKHAPYMCSRCAQVTYCGPECQSAHWPTHEGACVPAGGGEGAGAGAGAGSAPRNRRTVRRRTARRSRKNRRYTR